MWSLNPDQFVEDEDDDTFSYSVRISAQDLLLVGGATVNQFVKKIGVHRGNTKIMQFCGKVVTMDIVLSFLCSSFFYFNYNLFFMVHSSA